MNRWNVVLHADEIAELRRTGQVLVRRPIRPTPPAWVNGPLVLDHANPDENEYEVHVPYRLRQVVSVVDSPRARRCEAIGEAIVDYLDLWNGQVKRPKNPVWRMILKIRRFFS